MFHGYMSLLLWGPLADEDKQIPLIVTRDSTSADSKLSRAQQRKEQKKREAMERESDIVSARKRGVTVREEREKELLEYKRNKLSRDEEKMEAKKVAQLAKFRLLEQSNYLQKVANERQTMSQYLEFLERRLQDRSLTTDQRTELQKQVDMLQESIWN